MAAGFESVVDDLIGPASVAFAGEGSADDNEEVENVELAGDKTDSAAVSLLSGVVTVHPLLLSEGRVQDAKAARCSGKQPCRVSLSPQASGYISTNNRIKRQASTNGSSSITFEL